MAKAEKTKGLKWTKGINEGAKDWNPFLKEEELSTMLSFLTFYAFAVLSFDLLSLNLCGCAHKPTKLHTPVPIGTYHQREEENNISTISWCTNQSSKCSQHNLTKHFHFGNTHGLSTNEGQMVIIWHTVYRHYYFLALSLNDVKIICFTITLIRLLSVTSPWLFCLSRSNSHFYGSIRQCIGGRFA